MKIKKGLSVNEFTKLVGHHSEGNIRVFRERLRINGVIQDNQLLNENFIPMWNEICKLHDQGVPWVKAMDQIINNHTNIEKVQEVIIPTQPEIFPANHDQKLDEIISILRQILKKLDTEKLA